jgi:hypothetical protein
MRRAVIWICVSNLGQKFCPLRAHGPSGALITRQVAALRLGCVLKARRTPGLGPHDRGRRDRSPLRALVGGMPVSLGLLLPLLVARTAGASSAAGARSDRQLHPTAPAVGALPVATDDSPGGALAPKTFDVSQFGAVGDGKTNSTAAVRAAATALREAGGGVLLFPKCRSVVCA